MITKFSISVFIGLFLFFFALNAASAVTVGCPDGYRYPWCGTSTDRTPGGLVERFYEIGLAVVGVAAFGVMIYGAILWSMSGAVTSKEDALDWIKGALWGVLLLGAVLILEVINPNLLNLKNPDLLDIDTTSTTVTPTSPPPTTVTPTTSSPPASLPSLTP